MVMVAMVEMVGVVQMVEVVEVGDVVVTVPMLPRYVFKFKVRDQICLYLLLYSLLFGCCLVVVWLLFGCCCRVSFPCLTHSRH